MRGNENNYNDLKDGEMDGGFQLPSDNLDDFYKALEKDNLFRRLATRVNLTQAEGTIHAVTSTGQASIVEEGNLIPEDGDEITQFPLGSHKIAGLSKLLKSFVLDNSFNLAKYLTDDFARRFARAEEDLFINGYGLTNHSGILANSTSIDSVATNTLSYEEILKLYFAPFG